MIVDVHGHWGPWFFSTEVADISENIRVMDTYDIDIQLVSAVEAVVYDPLTGNPALAEQIRERPRLKGMLVVDPRELDVAERQLAELLPSGLFVGAKIHSQYADTPAGTPAMADALALLTEHELPVLVHTWGEEIVGLADVVASVPGARVIAAHLGGPAWQLAPEAAARTERLWFEPCYSMPPAGRVRWVLDRIGASRLLFGSDATLIDPSVTLAAVRAAGLNSSQEAMIMSQNAVDLFGLEVD